MFYSDKSVQKEEAQVDKKKKINDQNFDCSYLGISYIKRFPSNLGCGLPYQVGNSTTNSFHSEKGSQSYKCMKLMFPFFLSIYPRRGVPASGLHDILLYALISATAEHMESVIERYISMQSSLYIHHSLTVTSFPCSSLSISL